jgi:two-component system LytT family response regulator
MALIKAVLVDDESDNIKTLELLLKKYCPDVVVEATFTEPKAALKALPKTACDILFLDIEMPEINGFELLKRLKKFDSNVVFVTAHSNYAVRAFKFSALDYILKPIDVDDLKATIEKQKKTRTTAPDRDMMKQLLSNIDLLSNPKANKLSLSTQEGIEILTLSDVDYMKAERSYTMIKRQDKTDLMVSKPLKDFEDMLPHSKFMRIHDSYIINLDKVLRYLRQDGGYAVMRDGTEILISRGRKDDFLKYLQL